MTDPLSSTWDEPPAASVSREIRQISTAVVLCFLVSGAVGLIYEVLWIRLLGLVFGHTVFAVTTVLASFMAGLGIGSYTFGRIADRSTRLLTFYGLLEIGIGVYCLLLPNFLGWVEEVYLWISRALTLSYITFSAVQFLLVALLLVIPTCLMGATLPVLARFFVREEATLRRQVGMLYSVNTLGAVFGALLAGYWLVPALGIHTTIRLAVVMNVGIGSLVLVFQRHLHRLAAAQRRLDADACAPADPGAASMIYEVTWSRALTLIIGSSTYALPQSLYETGNDQLNYRILRSYRSTDLPPLSPSDRAHVDTAEGRYSLGRALMAKGFPREAEAEFSRAGRLDPFHTGSRMAEARLLIRRGMVLRAVRILEEILVRQPREPQAHFLLGMAYHQQGLPEQALAALRRAVGLAPGEAEYQLRLGALLREQGNLDQARVAYEAARALRPTDPDTLLSLADVHLAQGHLPEALALLQPLLTHAGQQSIVTRARVRHLVGLVHLRARRLGEAVAAFEAAAHLAPLNAGIRLDLSQAYEAKGDLDRAAETLDRLLAFYPNHLVATRRLAALLGRLETPPF